MSLTHAWVWGVLSQCFSNNVNTSGDRSKESLNTLHICSMMTIHLFQNVNSICYFSVLTLYYPFEHIIVRVAIHFGMQSASEYHFLNVRDPPNCLQGSPGVFRGVSLTTAGVALEHVNFSPHCSGG